MKHNKFNIFSSIRQTARRKSQDVRDSSKNAFFQLKNSGKYTMEWQLTGLVLKSIQPATRQLLSKATGYPINKITKYARILIDKGLAVESIAKEPCKTTGVKAYYLRPSNHKNNQCDG